MNRWLRLLQRRRSIRSRRRAASNLQRGDEREEDEDEELLFELNELDVGSVTESVWGMRVLWDSMSVTDNRKTTCSVPAAKQRRVMVMLVW